MKKMLKKLMDKKQAAPRDLKEIQAEYGQLVQRAGQVQYVVAVNEQELANINQRLFQVNNEAGERQKLDAEVAAEKAKTAATPEKKA